MGRWTSRAIPAVAAGAVIALALHTGLSRFPTMTPEPHHVEAASQGDAIATSAAIGDSRRNAITRAIEIAAPAVVSINVLEVKAERLVRPFDQLFWDFFYDARPRRRLRQQRVDAIGSGFIIDRAGHVLTNYHVVEGADDVVSVTLPDGRELPVHYVGADPRTDIALLRITEHDQLPHITWGDSNDILIGEWVIAIGNPFGPLMGDTQPTVSVGVVSTNHRRVNPNVGGGERLYQDMIQTDAAINPGNSGGPLVNATGQVIGVNTMIFSRSGGNIGLGFAIPAARARRVAGELAAHGRRRDPWPGFQVEDIHGLRPNIRQELGIDRDSGCIVVNILRDCPAYEAGMRPGDVILSVGGRPVQSGSDLDFAVWDTYVGDTMAVEVEREGRRHAFTFPVEELGR